MDLSITSLVLASLCFSLAAVPVARSLALCIGLVDKPSNRKRHIGAVPLAGGMVVVVGLWLSIFFVPASNAVWAVLLLSLPLFALGAADDKYDLPAGRRVLFQLLVGCGLFIFGLSINKLDGVFGHSSINLLPLASVAFTLICSCGVLNAINMSDGIDGLLGSVSCISLAAIAWLAFGAGAYAESAIALWVIGLITGYLTYNLGLFGDSRRIFLGDSGSMVIGLVLLVLLIKLSQVGSAVITPTSAGWILGLPLLDTVSVMIRRIASGRSPFTAGRDHFHHILQDLGTSRSNTLRVLVGMQVIFVSVGLFANQSNAPQYVFLWLFVAITVAQYVGVSLGVKYIGNGQLTEHGVVSNRLRNIES